MKALSALIAITLQFAPTPAPGQARAATLPARGSIEGDVYLLMRNGDVKKGAGRTVYLLRGELAGKLNEMCDRNLGAAAAATLRAAAVEDTIARTRSTLTMDSLMSMQRRIDAAKSVATGVNRRLRDSLIVEIAKHIVDTSGSGMAAHFRFAGVPTGVYLLYATWDVMDNTYTWWAPVSVGPGQVVKRDLDNAAEGLEPLWCKK